MKSEFKTEKLSSASPFHVYWFVKKFVNNLREFSSGLKFKEMKETGFNLINDLAYFF